MAYLCVFTDTNNVISFGVSEHPVGDPNKYLEFAKYVTNAFEKVEIMRMLPPLCLSDLYMIFSLMEGELWTPVPPPPPTLQRHDAIRHDAISEAITFEQCENLNNLRDYMNNMFIEHLAIESIEEEPEISDPD